MKKAKLNKADKALYECQYRAAAKAVDMFFHDLIKTEIWMNVENPLLGNISPADMIQAGRFDKLIDFIYTQLEEEKSDV